MRLAFKGDFALGQRCVRILNVFHFEIDNGAGMVEFRLLRNAEHQSYATAVEKSHVWNFEQMFHAEFVTIENYGAFQIMGGHIYLPDLRQGKFSWVGHDTSPHK